MALDEIQIGGLGARRKRVEDARFVRGKGNYIDVRASVEKDTVSERLHLGFNVFHKLLTGNRSTQKRFENGNQHLSFVESKSSV